MWFKWVKTCHAQIRAVHDQKTKFFGIRPQTIVHAHERPTVKSPTWWGAGSVEGGTGAGGITGATGLGLVEGPFQLSPPLDPAVLLTEVLEDLLCREQTETSTETVKTSTENTQKWQLSSLHTGMAHGAATLTLVAFYSRHFSTILWLWGMAPMGCQSKSIPHFLT